MEHADPDLVGFAELIAELAVSYLDERGPGPRPALVQQIVAGAVVIIPGVIAAAVETFSDDGLLQAPIAEGDDVARAVMEAQNRAGHGPCLASGRDNKQVFVTDFGVDQRWPDVAAEMISLGVHSMLCTPLDVNDHRLGVLSLISDTAGFGEHDDDLETMARIFAAHAGVALSGAANVAEIQRALDGRDVIGQAKGILMERFRMTPDVAFAMLVRTSANTNTKLRTVCDQLCQTGILLPSPPSRRRGRTARG